MILMLVLGALLLYIGMSHMLPVELPLPDFIHYETHPFAFALSQLLLTSVILILGRDFYVRGIPALLHGVPNMDTLVSIGTLSAYLYSFYSLCQIAAGNVHAVHELYFEGAGVVVALVRFGKHLEARSKQKSMGAISALLKLRPDTTILYKDGKEVEIGIDEVCVNDSLGGAIPGDQIPIDAFIVEGSASIDGSMLSGESMPVRKKAQDEVIRRHDRSGWETADPLQQRDAGHDAVTHHCPGGRGTGKEGADCPDRGPGSHWCSCLLS